MSKREVRGLRRLRRRALAVIATLCAACGASSDAGGPSDATRVDAPIDVAAPSATVTASAKPRLVPDLDGASEVDQRVDELATGSVARAVGATGEVQLPEGWTGAPSEQGTLGRSPAGEGSMHVGTNDATEASVDAATRSLAISKCTWGPSSNVTVGQDERASTIADGTCMRGAVALHATLFEDREAQLLVLGVWAQRADGVAIFGSIRSLRKRTLDGMAVCCMALAQNAKSAPPQLRNTFIGAAAICNASKNDPAALGQLRAILAGSGVTLPAACR